jgi:glutamine---fructose-6-phosphate transaminase (isomerizing)
VNVEDSPLTRVINEFADAQHESWYDSENIGMYMKSGFCYSDVKSFIPEVMSMALVALWFSFNKHANSNKEIKQKRINLIKEIIALPKRFEHALQQPKLNAKYEEVSDMLSKHHNLFILAKGAGFFTANYVAQKFLQVSGLHAEAYPCAEFRHGPLSMIDEREKTPGKHFSDPNSLAFSRLYRVG